MCRVFDAYVFTSCESQTLIFSHSHHHASQCVDKLLCSTWFHMERCFGSRYPAPQQEIPNLKNQSPLRQHDDGQRNILAESCDDGDGKLPRPPLHPCFAAPLCYKAAPQLLLAHTAPAFLKPKPSFTCLYDHISCETSGHLSHCVGVRSGCREVDGILSL